MARTIYLNNEGKAIPATLKLESANP